MTDIFLILIRKEFQKELYVFGHGLYQFYQT